MRKVAVINGPNNNFYGIRNKAQYGNVMYEDIVKMLKEYGEGLGFEMRFFQSNHEGEIVDYLQQCYLDGVDGIVMNPGALTHYSYSVRDAIESISIPTIECHMSNNHKRDEFRQKSMTAPVCIGQVMGLGINSFRAALTGMKLHLDDIAKTVK